MLIKIIYPWGFFLIDKMYRHWFINTDGIFHISSTEIGYLVYIQLNLHIFYSAERTSYRLLSQ